ncbi:MAG: CapA family protein [Bacteroidota bacterium]
MKAVRPYSFKGKFLCGIIYGLMIPIAIVKGRKWRIPREFEENPRTMRFKDIVYFAYKYYFHSSLNAPTNEIAEHFSKKYSIEPLVETLVTVSIGGDLMPYQMIRPETTTHLWDEVGSDFFGSDVVFANLESPMDTSILPCYVPEVMLSDMLFNGDQKLFDIFSGNGKYKGYDVLSTANNHSLDMGPTGVKNTMEYLHQLNIQSVGTALDNAQDPVIVVKNGITIGFVAYTYSLNHLELPNEHYGLVNVLPLNVPGCDITLIQEQTQQCRDAGADIVICSLHCGNAYQAYPSQTTVDLYQKIFSECGVDVIAGGHPHNLQPWQYYPFTDPFTGKQKRGFSIYSLGDFIAYDIYTWSHLCAYVKLSIGKNKDGEIAVTADVHPMVMALTNGQLQLKYAKDVLSKSHLSNEEKDLKLLYDVCVRP